MGTVFAQVLPIQPVVEIAVDLKYSQLGCEQEYTQDTLTFMDHIK